MAISPSAAASGQPAWRKCTTVPPSSAGSSSHSIVVPIEPAKPPVGVHTTRRPDSNASIRVAPRPRDPTEDSMDERTERVSALLHEAGEVHHVVYRITDGADDDWASFYADWLTQHSELPEVLGTVPVRSHLVHELVDCERAHGESASDEPWEPWYASRVLSRFG